MAVMLSKTYAALNFRKDCLRELKKIKDAWPDLHYQTVKGALLLSPSPPRIRAVAPAPRRITLRPHT